MDFLRPDIKYTPLEVETSEVTSTPSPTEVSPEIQEVDETARKLMDHLAIIEDYNNRIDAIDWLIDSARKLSGNFRYTTEDPTLLKAISTLGGIGNYVDLALFEKAVDTTIEAYQQMALMSLMGVNK